ncbi:hypothetical protein M0638_09760 [Roseomonas sp. NAR14]|uniref:Lipoprotein n=1 Tax=Roseomonas acroporae TaxID=2937791 RepID=A0A9X1Y9M5_9PROT|nr:hypothetical protein [Roseomonas acroporae]MCK8784667.1 hypothetical protein [Roseomonas acroporae]
MTRFTRLPFRSIAVLAALSVTACATGPGPYQIQANQANYACQMGDPNACYAAQGLAPLAQAEYAQQQQQNNAVVGTAVAAGALGIIAGAAIANSGPRYGYYGRGWRRW